MDPHQLGEATQVRVIRLTGSPIVIVDGAGGRHPLKARIGESSTEQRPPNASSSGPQTVLRTTDFLIPTEDLPGTVDRAWKFEFAGAVYRPVSPNNGPISRDSGRFGLIQRIHTVRIAQTP